MTSNNRRHRRTLYSLDSFAQQQERTISFVEKKTMVSITILLLGIALSANAQNFIIQEGAKVSLPYTNINSNNDRPGEPIFTTDIDSFNIESDREIYFYGIHGKRISVLKISNIVLRGSLVDIDFYVPSIRIGVNQMENPPSFVSYYSCINPPCFVSVLHGNYFWFNFHVEVSINGTVEIRSTHTIDASSIKVPGMTYRSIDYLIERAIVSFEEVKNINDKSISLEVFLEGPLLNSPIMNDKVLCILHIKDNFKLKWVDLD